MGAESMRSFWLGLSVLSLACNGGSVAQPPPRAEPAPAVEVPSPAPSAAVPAPSAALVASESPPAAPVPYPEAAIERARRDNSARACQKLVYKKGCAETRTGRVRVRFTLDAEGKVTKAEIVENGIRREPEVVADCLKKELPAWKLDPPGAAEPSFEMELSFADKC